MYCHVFTESQCSTAMRSKHAQRGTVARPDGEPTSGSSWRRAARRSATFGRSPREPSSSCGRSGSTEVAAAAAPARSSPARRPWSRPRTAEAAPTWTGHRQESSVQRRSHDGRPPASPSSLRHRCTRRRYKMPNTPKDELGFHTSHICLSPLKPNSITLSGWKLVGDRFEAGRGPVADLLARASSLLAS